MQKPCSPHGPGTPEVQIGECHGTGTALGDPIEIGAMKSVQLLGPNAWECLRPEQEMLGLLGAGILPNYLIFNPSY